MLGAVLDQEAEEDHVEETVFRKRDELYVWFIYLSLWGKNSRQREEQVQRLWGSNEFGTLRNLKSREWVRVERMILVEIREVGRARPCDPHCQCQNLPYACYRLLRGSETSRRSLRTNMEQESRSSMFLMLANQKWSISAPLARLGKWMIEYKWYLVATTLMISEVWISMAHFIWQG